MADKLKVTKKYFRHTSDRDFKKMLDNPIRALLVPSLKLELVRKYENVE